MTMTWTDQSPSGSAWGFDTQGGDAFDVSNGTGIYSTGRLPVISSTQVCRPPTPSDAHAIAFVVAWYDIADAVISVSPFGFVSELFDDAYWQAFGGVGPSTSDPTNLAGNPPYLLPPAGAVTYVVGVIDFGPYDGFGNATGTTSTYSPYESEALAFAETTSCRSLPNLSGLIDQPVVYFITR